MKKLNCLMFSFLFFAANNCKNVNSDASKMLTFLANDSSPKIISAVPAMGDKDLPRGQKVVILFDKPMNINSCVQSFSVVPATQGFYDLNDYSLSFTPSVLFGYGTYTYTITKNCESKEGHDLKDIFTASFTVGSQTSAGTFPEVKSVTVSAGSLTDCNSASPPLKNILNDSVTDACMGTPVRNKIKVQFSRAMDRGATVSAITFSPTFNVTYYWDSDTELSITPDSAFPYQSRINMTISTVAQDTQGIRMQIPVAGSFQVGTPNLVPRLSSLTLSTGTLADCLAGIGTAGDLTAASITNACLGNPTNNPIVFNFSRPMNQVQTQSNIGFSPSFTGTFVWSPDNLTLTFTPDAKLNYGVRYTISIGQNAVTTDRITVEAPSSYSFVAGGAVSSAPTVQAVGVASQGCATSFPGTGSASGGNWSAGSCYWDNTLPVLSPGSYTFRGGDDGNGNTNLTAACGDVNTDNFRLIFSNYMDLNSAINAVRLRRLSPPSTIVQLSSWTWGDCQAAFPYGCRVLNLSFAEQEASCNGSLFGNAVTGGDFNLLKSDTTPTGFPYYMITVDTSARDVNNLPFSSNFNFTMEAK
ncbi:Ig-like domain-containing protein [Leptospira sp. 'Mane']|uniref:Ig-like domain-containing protein n=1 Tax=Leptospira sp. 'Mane' TaxID=3387407 RepID=UPI00398B937D